ncbi:hypothetical protein AGMMS50239_29610 [Bacteroidia bacterium]|nr:hypothetical protein AGMMS50239_29610 [Bacteroidia bacterium]
MLNVYIQTIKNLKIKQILYRLYYSLNRPDKKKLITFSNQLSHPLNLQSSLNSYVSYFGNNTFSFLNKPYTFTNSIDWNYAKYGALWTYNLNYFEFLHQPDFCEKEGLRLINDYIFHYQNIKIGYDSYPVSLRNVFWIRFLSKYFIKDEKIDSFLYAQYSILQRYLEYHLLGNHLLENAFSLLFGAYYFKDKKIYKKAYKLLKKELNEQILRDGGHFELSPMYHQILLYRLLDCINVLSNNQWIEDNLFRFISEKASLMLSWLSNITLSSGTIPHFNDSTNEIAPSTKELFDYAEKLNVKFNIVPLSDSQYRIFRTPNIKCIMDIGGIMPKYQPGHAHADTFNFILEVGKQSVIVDTGCSTYEQGVIRNTERGTFAHNTVVINGKNSSQVWASHRVGKRANVRILKDTDNGIIAQHDGYKEMGVIHQRSFSQEENRIKIIDETLGNPDIQSVACFHLDKEINNIRLDGNSVILPDCCFFFNNPDEITIEKFTQAIAFNQRVESNCISVKFKEKLTTTIGF